MKCIETVISFGKPRLRATVQEGERQRMERAAVLLAYYVHKLESQNWVSIQSTLKGRVTRVAIVNFRLESKNEYVKSKAPTV